MSRCAICDREVSEKHVTKHHLEPKNRKSTTISTCQPCHKQIHAIFTNHELKHVYDTVERIRNHEDMQKFIKWIRKTDKTNVKVKESKKVRNWRR